MFKQLISRIGVVALTGMCGVVQAVPMPIDLNTFVQEGLAASGSWNVSADGTSVFQTINGNPTAFVSPNNFFNTKFQGSFGQEQKAVPPFGSPSFNDNDFIGFVFGFDADDATPFFVFDWKQGLQNGTPAGFYLAEVTGGLNSIPFSNHQNSTANYAVLATDTGAGRGWVDNVVYDFTLEYTETLIKIDIAGGAFGAGETIFNLATVGNTTGRFGFYNFSQEFVRYQGFTEEVAPTFCELNPTDPACIPGVGVPEPTTLVLLSLGLFSMGYRLRQERGR